MIIVENYKIREDGVTLVKIYSNIGKKILQQETGILYDDAVEPHNANRVYIETDIPVDQEDNDVFLPAQDTLDIIFGE